MEKPVMKCTHLGREGGAVQTVKNLTGVGCQKNDKPVRKTQVTPCQVNNLTDASVI